MCALRKELAVDFTELHVLEIRCGKCGTLVISDLNADKGWVPSGCPGCNTEFGDAFSQGVRDLKSAARLLNVVTKDRGGPSIGFKVPWVER